MSNEILLLAGTAASIGFVHTLFGPDHYLPFIVLSKARNWKIYKTLMITILCGIGHVGSSILIGSLGIGFGIGVSKLEVFEGMRGNLAAWAFIIFGFIYLLYGVWRLVKNKPHKHLHIHQDGSHHQHEHTHDDKHNHTHNKKVTPWVLFLIFVLGPCEPLIPFLMYPAAQNSIQGTIFVSLVFTIVTLLTMVAMVLILSMGYNKLKIGKLEKYTHVIAGAIIFLSGFAIVFLGL